MKKLSPEIQRALIRNENSQANSLIITIEDISPTTIYSNQIFNVTFFDTVTRVGMSVAVIGQAELSDMILTLNSQFKRARFQPVEDGVCYG